MCAYDGYSQLPEVIGVGAVGQDGRRLYGGEFCTSMFVVAYSQDAPGFSTTIVSAS